MILQRVVSLLLDGAATSSIARTAAAAHAAAVKSGHAADVFLSNHLIVSYATSGRLPLALRVFDEMPLRNLVSWSALISGCAQSGRPDLALDLFARMDVPPSEHVYASAARSCAALRALAAGAQVHARAVKSGLLGASSFVANSVSSMYIKCGRLEEGYGVFRELAEPTVVSYNAVISGLAASARPGRGLEVLRLMKTRGLRPDKFSYAAAVGISCELEDFRVGAALHSDTVKIGLDVTAFVGNVILEMYSKHGGTVKETEQVFLSVEEKDAVTWNTYIAAHSRRGNHTEALTLFRNIMAVDANVRPDDFTFASALAACAELSLIRHGKQVHGHLIRSSRDDGADLAVGNAIVSMYAKCGHMALAARAFDGLRGPNLRSWNTLISGFGRQGDANEAIEAFERMKRAGVGPDSVTFTGLLSACNHAGLVSQGTGYFESMSGAPGPEHVSCVVDLLARAGRLEEAERHVRASAFRDDPVVLGGLLSACRVHGDVAVGERVAARLLALRPATSSPYVLLSQLHASGGRWDGAAEAWRMMKEDGAGKKDEAGRSAVGFR
ncbi:hypothetical protein PR202_ga01775 [Eleusine coracana subsp. coracana]|uniref:Pentatricopeptide repeat-containing protein n=1 Tax=Eleusine coracana subsp. coracana TaxID=191504 RepID=A0AAV5BKH7_ELECO|nr:hypothetical protein PR202_ga01088 [Eleusine coracana subsp. coracana]GJM85962.1 hypothetical protein PR202_ga01775 [Eleusine coracana subsp. coracana]